MLIYDLDFAVKDFLQLNNSKIILRLVESSGMKTAEGFVKIANTNTNFEVLN